MDLIVFMCGMSVGVAVGAYEELVAHEGIELGAETTAAHPCARGSDDTACQVRRP